MLKVDEIRAFIENDKCSTKKQLAEEGQRYYEGEHDIKKYRVFFIDADGKMKEDKIKSYIRISHPFFTELTDQLTQYLLSGKDGFVKSDIPELQAHLDDYFNENEDFRAELEELITGTSAKGFDYMYAYRKADGKTGFEYADSLGVVEVRAKATDDNCDYFIYWYVDRIDKDSKEINRIQVWNDTYTWFYVQVDDGEITLDEEEEINPRPHTLFTNKKDGKTYFKGYGIIPFFRLDNNRKQISSLKPIKNLIDDYDLLNSDLSNNIQDTNEALYVVKGFQGDNLDELMQNIRVKKHIGVDEGGEIDIKTVDIPVEARKAKLELDEKNIYRFGFGLNTAGLKDTTATTNMAIKTAYSLLDLRANKMETRLKQFMRKLLAIVLDEINKADGTDYQQKDVYFDLQREVPTNALENAQIELTEAQKRQTEITTIQNLAAQFDNETVMKLICEQLDLDYEEIKDELPDPDEADVSDIYKTDSVPSDGSNEGDVIE